MYFCFCLIVCGGFGGKGEVGKAGGGGGGVCLEEVEWDVMGGSQIVNINYNL